MKEIRGKEYIGERPLYRTDDLHLSDVTVHEGESALKECRNICADDCRFEGKYVFWETDTVSCRNCYFSPSARAAVWYSKSVRLTDCRIDAPKAFRQAEVIHLDNVLMPQATEALWHCKDILLRNCTLQNTQYLFLHSSGIRIDDSQLDGDYSFQQSADAVIRNSVINSKDAFWDSSDCTLIDCRISGEYLGWYSRRLKLIRCHIIGRQPLCYCENLILEDCTFGENSDLAFEYSTLQASIRGGITSIKNPTSGHIRVQQAGEIIIDDNQKQPADCKIEIGNK